MTPAIILHGGTGAKSPALLDKIRQAFPAVLEKSYAVLEQGGAVEAVAEAVRLMEDDELFNAGTGAKIQADGRSRLSAAIMDGASQSFAAVVNVQEIRNPVLLAKALLREKHRVLDGAGAQAYALSRAFKLENTITPAALEGWKSKTSGSDTVGACAIDAEGKLASATSTGGLGGETPGRVSDSCTPAGNYADSFSALSATGIGEQIIDEALAARIAALVPSIGLEAAVARIFDGVRARKRAMGLIALDRDGRMAWDTTSPVLTMAWKKGAHRFIF